MCTQLAATAPSLTKCQCLSEMAYMRNACYMALEGIWAQHNDIVHAMDTVQCILVVYCLIYTMWNWKNWCNIICARVPSSNYYTAYNAESQLVVICYQLETLRKLLISWMQSKWWAPFLCCGVYCMWNQVYGGMMVSVWWSSEWGAKQQPAKVRRQSCGAAAEPPRDAQSSQVSAHRLTWWPRSATSTSTISSTSASVRTTLSASKTGQSTATAQSHYWV